MSKPVPPPPPRPSSTPLVTHDQEPTVVEVTITEIADREVQARLADGRTGVIGRGDFDQAALDASVGSEIRAAVLHREDARGRVHMSASWAAKSDAWHRVGQALEQHSILRGPVTKEVKGGLVVDLGLRGFLPRSNVGELPAEAGGELASLVGTEVEVTVAEVDRDKDRLVVSRRDAQRRTRRAEEKRQWSEMSPGQRHGGTVMAVLEYGAKVRIGDVVGLVHRSELSWAWFDEPGDVVTVGDDVEVVVLDVSRSRRRLGLSLKAAAPNPLESVEVGSVCDATIERVVEYGAFARIEPSGAEGLVHVSELSEIPGQRADQLVVPGETLRVKVLSVDTDRNRISLSALQANLID
ncbi:MAG: S1 RNA-binding domain-containing protein [Microthrixaceae bacterium]